VRTTNAGQVSAEELWSIVSEVWESILGQEARRVEHAFGLEEALTGAVGISGAWEGLVTFTCPRHAAEDITRAMLALAPDDPLTHDDVTDALGEGANVIGGQVKALCDGANQLGLPVVGTGMALPHAQACCRVGVEWAGHAARVGVWRSTARANGSPDGGAR
jgi:chemotaxis protein CheX